MKKTSMSVLVVMSLLMTGFRRIGTNDCFTSPSPSRSITTTAPRPMFIFAGGGQERRLREIPAWPRGLLLRSSKALFVPNRDTLYSFVIVDLDAGPVTVTLPDAGQALHGDAGSSMRINTPRGDLLRCGQPHSDEGDDWQPAMPLPSSVSLSINSNKEDVEQVPRPCRMRLSSVRSAQARFEVPHWDEAKPQEGTGSALAAWERRFSDTRSHVLAPAKIRSTRSSI